LLLLVVAAVVTLKNGLFNIYERESERETHNVVVCLLLLLLWVLALLVAYNLIK
jgi:hypothetical protein